MAEYRRDKIHREFFKIEGDKVTIILSKEKHVKIVMLESAMVAEEVKIDYEVSTESEFNEAFKEARDRILLDRL